MIRKSEKYIALFWDEKSGWHAKVFDKEKDAKNAGEYGNFCGYGNVICTAPVEAWQTEEYDNFKEKQ
jgi:hypothetical protein